ncbi:MAG: 50S ribosomal protein L30 [Gemmatimonadetes bacterium]|nr:50S ribosomal protein L30 [Gemmatimonadota bacterium]
MAKKAEGAAPKKARAPRAVAKRQKAEAAKGQAGQAGQKSGPRLRVKQVRSGIGHAETYRRTLRALGLRHHQGVVSLPDNPSVRGMLIKVRHLVSVQAAEA